MTCLVFSQVRKTQPLAWALVLQKAWKQGALRKTLDTNGCLVPPRFILHTTSTLHTASSVLPQARAVLCCPHNWTPPPSQTMTFEVEVVTSQGHKQKVVHTPATTTGTFQACFVLGKTQCATITCLPVKRLLKASWKASWNGGSLPEVSNFPSRGDSPPHYPCRTGGHKSY